MPHTHTFLQNEKYDRKYTVVFLIILFLLSLWMVFSYFPENSPCKGHDSDFHYRRINALMDALRNGNFPVYIDYGAIEGYGYGAKWFYSDFLLIPFAVIGNLTDIDTTYKIMIFIMTFLCGLFTFACVKRIYKDNFAACASALLFTFCIYRLQDLFYRSSLGEAWTFTFVPLVFWGLYEIIKGDYKKWYILAIGYSLIIFSHNLCSFMIAMPVILLLIIYNKSLRAQPIRFIYLVVAGAVTLVLTAYFLYPFFEQSLSNRFYYHSYFENEDLSTFKMNFRFLAAGLFTGILPAKPIFMPAMGFVLPIAVICRILLFFRKRSVPKSIDIIFILGLIFFFIASPLFPWNIFPFKKMGFIQFSWRFFEFSSFFFAVSGGSYLFILIKSIRTRIICTVGLIFLLSAILFKDGHDYQTRRFFRLYGKPASVATNYNLGELEYFPAKVPDKYFPDERGKSVIAENTDTKIKNFKRDTRNGQINIDIQIGQPDRIEFPLLYYKGYSAILNHQKLPVEESHNGLVQVEVSESGNLTIQYTGTTIQKISPWITIVSVILLCIYIFFQQTKRRRNEID